jgi:hypothetical protein
MMDTQAAAYAAALPLKPTIKAMAIDALILDKETGGDGLTADEIGDVAGVAWVSMRPSITNLKQDGKIVDTGLRRPNASGKDAAVWRLV